MLELWYFTWLFLVLRPFCGYHYFLPCDRDLGVWLIFWKTLTLLISFKQWVLELCYITWVFQVTIPFRRQQHLWPCDMTLEFVPCCNVITSQQVFLPLNILDVRDSIFLKNIPSDKIFLLVLNLLTLTFDLFFF